MRHVLVVAPLAVLAGASCGDAAGTVQGGQPLFAAPIDCTPGPAACATWTHMYGCYFGPQAPSGGCAGAGGECHATSSGTGAIPSGFVCGATQASCFQGITASDNASLPALVFPSSKMGAALYEAMYRKGSTPGPKANNMPLSSFGGPPVMNTNWQGFAPADVTCVQTWVNAGAPND